MHLYWKRWFFFPGLNYVCWPAVSILWIFFHQQQSEVLSKLSCKRSLYERKVLSKYLNDYAFFWIIKAVLLLNFWVAACEKWRRFFKYLLICSVSQFFFVLALRPIHLLLTDGQSFKCVMYNTCCFLLKLIGVVLQHHQVLSNSDEKQKSLKYDTFNWRLGQFNLANEWFTKINFRYQFPTLNFAILSLPVMSNILTKFFHAILCF